MTDSNSTSDDSKQRRSAQGSDLLAQLAQLPEGWWNQLRQLLELETGMELSGSRQPRLNEAVTNVIRKHRLPPTLLTDTVEHGRFVEYVAAELTVGESFFLRNEHHMGALHETIFPRILEENRNRREIRIWSAGCACGEEPYSLAILLHDRPEFQSWNISILGTDLNPTFLEKARTGWYRRWSFRQTQIYRDTRFFTPVRDGYQVRDFLRHQVRFSYLNLVKDIYPSGLNGTLGQDLILFRNVAIYLKPEATAAILQRMFQALRPGGWLLLGEIEVSLAPQIGFEVHRFTHATLHRKPLNAQSASAWSQPIAMPVPPPPVVTLVPHHPLSLPSLPMAPATPASQQLLHMPPASSVPPTPFDNNDVFAGISAPAEMTVRDFEEEIRQTTDPTHRASLRVRLAQACLQLAQTAQAREHLELSLRDNPLHIEAYLLLGGLDEDAGHLQQAEQSYRRALYLNRDCALIHFHLGLVLQQQGHLQRSQRSLETALELIEKHPSEDLAEHGDGVCYGRLREMILMLTGERSG